MTADAGSSRSAGQNALSTGAVSGISRPLVMKLGRDGARLIAVDRDAAGVARSGSMTEGSLQVWRESMAVNADSTMLAVRHALLALRQAGRGSIVTLRSLYRSKSKPGTVASSGSNAAVVMISCVAALKARQPGPAILVNCVLPGSVRTADLESPCPLGQML